jgi:predicted RNase H-like HicB family nuclease
LTLFKLQLGTTRLSKVTGKEMTVILEKGENNWPDLPGCIATRKTRAETLELMREAIESHIEGMRPSDEEVPKPKASTNLSV